MTKELCEEVEAWPLWKMSYDVREQLARLHGLELPEDLDVTVGEWLASTVVGPT